MIKYLIIDDEYIAHDIIKNYCDLLPNMQLMKNCYDAFEAFDYLTKNEVDLIFLDLNMPILKGFDFLNTLNNPPKVIVTTAHKEHALEGYEHNLIDYLLKPFSFERFLKALNKTFTKTTAQPSALYQKNEISSRIFLQSNKKYIQIEINTIQFIEAAGNYSKIVTTSETITIRKKISTLLKLLPVNNFLQVHKSFAVAPNYIKSIEGDRITLINEHIIPIGTLFKTNILHLLK